MNVLNCLHLNVLLLINILLSSAISQSSTTPSQNLPFDVS